MPNGYLLLVGRELTWFILICKRKSIIIFTVAKI